MRSIVTVNPMADFRVMEEMMDRLFSAPTKPNAQVLPVDVVEQEGAL